MLLTSDAAVAKTPQHSPLTGMAYLLCLRDWL